MRTSAARDASRTVQLEYFHAPNSAGGGRHRTERRLTLATGRAAGSDTRRAVYIGGMLRLPSCRRRSGKTDRNAAGCRSGRDRAGRARRLLGRARVEGSLFVGGADEPPARLRRELRARERLYAADDRRRPGPTGRQRDRKSVV